MTDRFTSSAHERWRISLTERFKHYFTLNPEKRIRLGAGGRRGRILIDPADLQAFMQECRVETHPLLDE